jgi:pSer/pThr/pTyr-binding forkhead associated (FHA) protein
MPTIKIYRNGELLEAVPANPLEACQIGRDTACDVLLEDQFVSAHHARIEPRGNGFILIDLQSQNGTAVNGKQIESVWLNDGDIISIGPYSLQFANPLKIAVPPKLCTSITETISVDSLSFKDNKNR